MTTASPRHCRSRRRVFRARLEPTVAAVAVVQIAATIIRADAVAYFMTIGNRDCAVYCLLTH
jgi:hypothetical protein